MTVAFLLSLLVHIAIIRVLLAPEPPAPTANRLDVVSVRLVPAQPAATAAAMSSSTAQVAAAAASPAPEQTRKFGNTPRVAAEPKAARASALHTPPAIRTLAANAPRATQPAPNAATPAMPHFDESPQNAATDSLSDYLRLLALRLAEVKQYPAAAVARHEQGEVLLGFRLDRSGRVLSWQIVRSSGHGELDAEAARMIDRAPPFPPFPSTWRAGSAGFQVPIGFSLYR
ncbi:MAG: energy transducer TonB [Proteobacteria bacterium]|uniref:energy transducer TonB n=1 Tax=Rudaea sp. TaxID=2136325 RepID=UPI0032201DC4|nr:energy transducer TonB [Pseudomonadota bacterium]